MEQISLCVRKEKEHDLNISRYKLLNVVNSCTHYVQMTKEYQVIFHRWGWKKKKKKSHSPKYYQCLTVEEMQHAGLRHQPLQLESINLPKECENSDRRSNVLQNQKWPCLRNTTNQKQTSWGKDTTVMVTKNGCFFFFLLESLNTSRPIQNSPAG